MIRQDRKTNAKGETKTQVRVVKAYRDENGNPKQKTIKDFGYLEDQSDPVAFMRKVQECNAELKKKKSFAVRINPEISFLDSSEAKLMNFGYAVFGSVFDQLGLNEVLEDRQGNLHADLNSVLRFLVIQRLMNPDSKRASYQRMGQCYGLKDSFSLPQLYRSLDRLADCSEELQAKANETIGRLTDRDLAHAFYDSTNFYFQKDFESPDEIEEVDVTGMSQSEIRERKIFSMTGNDGTEKHFRIKEQGLLKRGVSKEHSVDPIVQMGLCIDDNGIPVHFGMYSGNTSDSRTMPACIRKVKESHGISKVTFVADKGMNCGENIDLIVNGGDEYLFSQILRGKKGKRYHEKMFEEDRYTVVNDDYKYQIFEEEYPGKGSDGNKVMRKRKVLIYWSGEDARMTRHKRQEKIYKAMRSTGNGIYSVDHSFRKYLSVTHCLSSTGEVADEARIELDEEKIKEDEKFDGYFCLVTSDLTMDEKRMRETYAGLWRIEQSFRIQKTDLIARPVFVFSEKHIKAHFVICYIALVILRLIQVKMGYSLSFERIERALDMCSCSLLDEDTVSVVRKGSFLGFKTTAGEKEGISLSLSEEEETVKDMKLIIEALGLKACPPLMDRASFDSYLGTMSADVNSKTEK